MEEMGRNPRVTEALGKAMSAKGKVDERTRQTLRQIGLAAADEIKDLRAHLEQLEKRLAELEDGKPKTAAKKPAREEDRRREACNGEARPSRRSLLRRRSPPPRSRRRRRSLPPLSPEPEGAAPSARRGTRSASSRAARRRA